MLPQLPAFNLPTTLGRELTIAEAEQLFTDLRDYFNGLSATLDTSIQPDGTLQNGIITNEKLSNDRPVSQNKLQFNYSFFVNDTGSNGTYVVTTSPGPAESEVIDSGEYIDGILLFVKAATSNTGPSTLNFGGHGAQPIKKLGGNELDGGEILADSVFAVMSSGNEWFLVAGGGNGSASSSQAANFTGLSQFSDTIAVPDPGGAWAGAVSSEVVHGLDVIPQRVQIRLKCINDDAGFTAGTHIPIENCYDNATGNPAFNVEVTTSKVKVTRLIENIYAGGSGPLDVESVSDAADWSLEIHAEKTVDVSTPSFPSLQLRMSMPEGCISYGGYMYVVNRQAWPDRSVLLKISLSSGVAEHITTFGVATALCAMTVHNLTSGPAIIIKSENRAWKLDLNDDTVTEYSSTLSNDPNNAVVWVDETSDPANPDFYTLRNYFGSSSNLMNSLLCYQDLWSGSYSISALGSNLNLVSGVGYTNQADLTGIIGTAAGIEIVYTGWNPIKRRLYVVDRQTFLCHIFEISGAKDFPTWWNQADATRLTAELTYIKSVAVMADTHTYLASVNRVKWSLEWDLSTGQEKAWSLYDNLNSLGYAGPVTRVPWKE